MAAPGRQRGRPKPAAAATARPKPVDSRTAPDTTPGPIQSVSVVNTAALRRLVELHCRGWLTRAEVEAEFGLPYDQLAAAARSWRLS